MFSISKKDEHSKARTGLITTSHGTVETPSYVVVGTNAEVRCLPSEFIPKTKTQMIIANTYHLWRGLGDALQHFEGLNNRLGWQGTTMTDSGGFQVFSLGFAREHGVGKIASMFPEENKSEVNERDKNLVRITNEGAFFMDGDKEYFLDAAQSIKIQEKLGADIILAFDECTSPLHDYAYTKNAMERTHVWADQCLKTKSSNGQKLYGIVQGGAFEDLRKESARTIGTMPFHGFAIGGSLGKSREEMFRVIRWTTPLLEETKPRHLLGIGSIEDLLEGVSLGIDTFDCVIPTREARHARLWTSRGHFSVIKGMFREDKNKIDASCECHVCKDLEVTRKELHRLFKEKDSRAVFYATLHNVFFFNDFMEKIREAIREHCFSDFKKEAFARLL